MNDVTPGLRSSTFFPKTGVPFTPGLNFCVLERRSRIRPETGSARISGAMDTGIRIGAAARTPRIGDSANDTASPQRKTFRDDLKMDDQFARRICPSDFH